MQIYYVGDNEGPVLMDLDTLVGNFNDSNGWFSDESLGTYAEVYMRHDLDAVGWYAGIHENGHYLVLNLAQLQLTLTPEAWDNPMIYPAGKQEIPRTMKIIVLNKAEGQIELHTMPLQGATVILRDYDIVPENFHADDVEFDEEGRAYVPIVWGPKP